MKLVYRLRFHEEKSITDIAAQLNVSASTVKNHLQRIRKRLQETLAQFSSLLLSFYCYGYGNLDFSKINSAILSFPLVLWR